MSEAEEAPEPTAPAREGWASRLLGLLLALVGACGAWLPRPLAYLLGSLAGAVVHGVSRWRRRALERRGRGPDRNLRIAFPERSPAERARILRRYHRHLGWLAVEFLRQVRVGREQALSWIDPQDLARLQALQAEGKGVIFVSGHMGNWEMLNHVAGLLGIPFLSLARPVPVPALQRWLLARRERTGGRVLPKLGGLWPLRKQLKRGEAVGLLVDENMRRGGVFVPLFGVLAATNQTVHQLQRVSKAPIAVLTCQRLAPGRFKLHLWDVLPPGPPDEPAEEGCQRVLGAIARCYEQALNAYPEQWLWSLRRWETRPEGEQPGPDGLPPRVG